ncbi:MAG TPA: AI-2E family transporter, partial [Phycisphaerales bacterium]|nr:AI-2E family transporter [Phycisphaerales bacterium]
MRPPISTPGPGLEGVLLALWGFLIVSSADNVLKPYFIARQAKLPLPLVLIGATGGVLGFGVIGVFVGPVVIGLMRSLW